MCRRSPAPQWPHDERAGRRISRNRTTSTSGTDHLVAFTVKRIRRFRSSGFSIPNDLVYQYKLLQWRILEFLLELLLVQILNEFASCRLLLPQSQGLLFGFYLLLRLFFSGRISFIPLSSAGLLLGFTGGAFCSAPFCPLNRRLGWRWFGAKWRGQSQDSSL